MFKISTKRVLILISSFAIVIFFTYKTKTNINTLMLYFAGAFVLQIITYDYLIPWLYKKISISAILDFCIFNPIISLSKKLGGLLRRIK